MTTVPVRALTTMRAGGSPGCTSMFSIMLMNDTRWLLSMGARTTMDTLSRALATSLPNLALMAWMMLDAVVKSPSRRFSSTLSALSNELSTAFSTVAPPGMRAEVVTPVDTLEPAPPASMPVAVSEPWASA